MNRREFITTCATLTAGAIHKTNAFGQANAAPRRKVRAGMIGTTHSHAAGKLEAMRKAPDWFDVVGVAEADEGRRKSLAGQKAYAGIPLMTEEQLLNLPGLEAVVIEGDIEEFVPVALKCAEAGLHIHLEKPAGTSLPAFRSLVQKCREKRLALQMGYMLRQNPAFQFCFKAVREGWLGEIYEVHGIMGKVIGAGERKEWARYKGGAMFELGSHLIDATVAVLGKPSAVHAYLKRTRPELDDLADNTLAVCEYPKATATIRSAAVDVEGFARRQFIVCGDRGAITILPLEPAKLRFTLDRAQGGFAKGTQEVELPKPGGRYDAQMIEFARVIRGEIKPEFDYAHDLAVHETLLRASEMKLDA